LRRNKIDFAKDDFYNVSGTSWGKESPNQPLQLTGGVVVLIMLTNRIPESTLLMREGRKTLRVLQGEIKKITDQLKRGNMSPGIGNKPIGRGITESRIRGGARVYWRVRDGQTEILGISGKDNQQKVINEVLQHFGGQ
jgi:putative component of toxin-antitoxin plasmid stabilization module